MCVCVGWVMAKVFYIYIYIYLLVKHMHTHRRCFYQHAFIQTPLHMQSNMVNRKLSTTASTQCFCSSTQKNLSIITYQYSTDLGTLMGLISFYQKYKNVKWSGQSASGPDISAFQQCSYIHVYTSLAGRGL
jgi:23S rRNA maturation mini-RNase III